MPCGQGPFAPGSGRPSITSTRILLVANIGGLLAASGYRVLLVDLDPQGNLAEDLGYTASETDDAGKALAGALAFGDTPAPVVDVRPHLDVLVGGYHLNAAAAALTNKAGRDPRAAQLALAEIPTPIAGAYDLVLIDCPPGNEPLQSAAVAAARWAVVPVKTDHCSRMGLLDVARRLDDVMDVNPDLDLLGSSWSESGQAHTRSSRPPET